MSEQLSQARIRYEEAHASLSKRAAVLQQKLEKIREVFDAEEKEAQKALDEVRKTLDDIENILNNWDKAK